MGLRLGDRAQDTDGLRELELLVLPFLGREDRTMHQGCDTDSPGFKAIPEPDVTEAA